MDMVRTENSVRTESGVLCTPLSPAPHKKTANEWRWFETKLDFGNFQFSVILAMTGIAHVTSFWLFLKNVHFYTATMRDNFGFHFSAGYVWLTDFCTGFGAVCNEQNLIQSNFCANFSFKCFHF